MRKKTILKLFLLIAFATSMYSCIHDDVYSASEPSNNEYQSKSPWREDEKYIKNVKAVFDEYGDKNYFNSNFGSIYWDYAVTMGTRESFLEAPVIKNNKVSFILLVYKDGDRVFFKRKEDEEAKKFFTFLVFHDRAKLKETQLNNSLNSVGKGGCVSITTTWTWTNESTGVVEYTTTNTEMYCLPSGPSLPCQALEVDGNCGNGSGGGSANSGGGSGGGGGYPYTPEIKEFTDNCTKVKTLSNNATFKSNITNLEGKTGLKGETGYIQRTDGNYTYQDAAGQSSTSNTLSLPRPDLPENKNIMGYLHTHVNDYTYTNADGIEETRTGIKMFSPADIDYFMDMLRNAQEAGRPLSDVYAVMVTSSGNYQIRFTGNQYQLKNFTSEQIKNFTNDFPDFMAKYSGDLETGFLNFLSEKMNVKATNLYKMDSNGTNYEIKLTAEKTKMTSGCPG